MVFLRAGQACVGVHDERQAGLGGEAGNDGEHLVRAQGAVHAEGVHAEPFEHGHHGGRVGAGHEFCLRVIDAGDEHGQVAVLLGGEHGGLGLVGVVHRFDEDEVGTMPGGYAYAFGEDLHGVFEGQFAEGLEHLAQRADVEGGEAVCLLFRGEAADGRAHVVEARDDDVFELVAEFQHVRAEGVGRDDVRTGFQILLMYADDVFGAGKVPAFGQFAGLEAAGLEQGAHSAVAVGARSAYFFKQVHTMTSR